MKPFDHKGRGIRSKLGMDYLMFVCSGQHIDADVPEGHELSEFGEDIMRQVHTIKNNLNLFERRNYIFNILETLSRILVK